MQSIAKEKVVVLDAGGQYCHLIARRLRHMGIYADVKPCATASVDLEPYKGIIISGGPSSVYDDNSPRVDEGIFRLGKPVLGICYGHQLMAHILGGTVSRGSVAEYGLSRLSVTTRDSLFKDSPDSRSVWMSHRDLVTQVPSGFELLATTPACPVAAMGDHARKLYGVQFHPEVVHTEYGNETLKAFLVDVCGCTPSVWRPAEQIDALVEEIRSKVTGRKVFFFISGGVDSTVAFVLCLRALGKERVRGVFVDTGFMRDVDIEDINFLRESEHAAIRFEDAKAEFIGLIKNVYSPEKKRRLIGEHFLSVHERILRQQFEGHESEWVLVQGTIYPDTIESGGTEHSATIKTHHNRVGTILIMLKQGRVIEPLSQFYKDEVRLIGQALGIDGRILNKQPFPGPGLAIRSICSSRAKGPYPTAHPGLSRLSAAWGFSAAKLDLKTVGVKGDERSYQNIALLWGEGQYDQLEAVSTRITNHVPDITRVLYLASAAELRLDDWHVTRSFVTEPRLKNLRSADSLVREYMRLNHPQLLSEIWQFPVVLIPLVNKTTGQESIVLRPVDSVDGMTASFTKLPRALLLDLASRIQKTFGLHVFFDVTNKPPATIEWE